MDIQLFQDVKDKVISNVSRVIIGKNDVIEMVLISYICGGHVLLEDIPGVGKTKLVKAFARTMGSNFKRIQFTPDLLPSDLTGINFYNQKINGFEFRPGPLFTNFVLADEINRATPRTQSSLLEAMEEKQITVDGETRILGNPFMVLATQNPVETYGTFPLPEAQLDRFFIRLSIGYPQRSEEIEIIRNNQSSDADALECAVNPEEIEYIKNNYQFVRLSDDVMGYLMAVIEATRKGEDIRLGASPRGSIALSRASQAYAALNGRDYVIPEDIKKMAPYVLGHRIIRKNAGRDESAYDFVVSLLETIQVPTED